MPVLNPLQRAGLRRTVAGVAPGLQFNRAVFVAVALSDLAAALDTIDALEAALREADRRLADHDDRLLAGFVPDAPPQTAEDVAAFLADYEWPGDEVAA